MSYTRKRVLAVAVFALAAIALPLLVGRATPKSSPQHANAKAANGFETGRDSAGEGPLDGYEAYLAAQRSYPADAIPPQVTDSAAQTFEDIASTDAKWGDPGGQGHSWNLYGPRQSAIQPGVTSFSGATNQTASRVTTLVVAPTCGSKDDEGSCTVWVGVSGGGVWKTTNALDPDPTWKHVTKDQLDQNSVGTLTLDPTDKKGRTLYLGTGEGNRCSSGCEAGVGVYKSSDGGKSWDKLPDRCVSNATYTCVNPGGDSFLGRGINAILVDPSNPNHIFVGSARGVRGLSHVIGNGGQTSLAPGSNNSGLYESTDGGRTFTEVWDGGSATAAGVTDAGFDPIDTHVVYASAFDAGLWRRDAGAAQTAFTQVFKPQFAGAGTDRTSFALTVKNAKTRIYLTDGTANANGTSSPTASNFWRTDAGNQPAATLLASQAAGSTAPPSTTAYPQTYTGWQKLTSTSTASPYFATDDFCTGQCWYDNKVYTPAGFPDTVYVIGSMNYGEQPCDTKGVGCGNGRSNGRAVLYSDTAGDPDSTNNFRTFTDLTYDTQDTPAPWCAYQPYFPQGCVHAPNGIHPDEHVIAINPSNPTQIFEGSDGGMIRTSGSFGDISAQCDSPYRNGGGPLPPTSGSYTTCKRLLSRVPTQLDHINNKLSSSLQFINVAIDPFSTCGVLGGTQDNGTWMTGANCDRDTFTQVIYGDGGNAVYDSTHQGWLANEFTGGFGDSNFENGDPTKWVISTGPIAGSGEAVAFYWPQIGDPNPVPGTHPLYEGAQHVWRSWAFGAGTTGQVPQDTTPNIADYEARCPEFVTSGTTPTCGDFMPLGGPKGSNTPGDLTGTVYGADRTGGSVSWLARDAVDHGTLWAATSAGRIFVSHNADASDPATVTWHRIDSSTAGGSPTRFPSSIYVDPANTGHAWITYSGYNATTPTTPGHVFDVWENGTVPGSGSFTNLNAESGSKAFPTPGKDGDLPVADVVRDDSTKTLYVATDFGVLRGDNDGLGGWHVTDGMPRYEVMHLEIQPSSRVATCAGQKHCPHVLYAATHSQGIWKLNVKD
jgi:hypothetical protein